MPLENAAFINGLDATNPAAGDALGQADDHLRLIKAAVKATFPNVTAAVTLTHNEINGLPARMTTVEALVTGGANIYPGEIRMYGGATAPSKWLLCQGQTLSRTTYASLFAVIGTAYGSGDGSTTFRLPDFRSRYARGANGDLGASAGSLSVTTSSAGVHSHGGSTGSTSLTLEQLPSHSHSGTTGDAGNHNHGIVRPSGIGVVAGGSGSWSGTSVETSFTEGAGSHSHNFTTSSAGGGQGHSHAVTSDGSHTHTVDMAPPFVSVNYIIYTGV